MAEEKNNGAPAEEEILTEEKPAEEGALGSEEENEEEKKKEALENLHFIKQEKTDEYHWYVVHVYSGYENKVMANIKKSVENRGLQDIIVDVKVPMEETIEIKNGKKKHALKKMYPAYVMVKMILTDESWYVVRNTTGVTGFVGPGSKPIPLTNKEVRAMGVEDVHVKLDVEIGDSIIVTSGPLESFVGTIEEVHPEKQKVKVTVSMFGRDTLVELDFVQIRRI